MKDVLLKVTKALPAAGAAATTDTIDLGPQGGHLRGDNCQLQINIPATPALVDTKTITVSLTDSADDSSFAAIEGYGAMVTTGAGGVGAAAKEWKLKLHNKVRRYLRVTFTVLAAGGDNTGVTATAAIVWP